MCLVEGQYLIGPQLDSIGLIEGHWCHSVLNSLKRKEKKNFIGTNCFSTFTMVEFTLTSQSSSPCMGQATLVYLLMYLLYSCQYFVDFYGFHNTSWSNQCPMTPTLVVTLTTCLQGTSHSVITLVTLLTIVPTPRGVSSPASPILCPGDIILGVGQTSISITLIPLRSMFLLWSQGHLLGLMMNSVDHIEVSTKW